MRLLRLRRGPRSHSLGLWLMLSPFLAGSLILVVLPTLASIAIAFTGYAGFEPPRGLTLASFERVFADPEFHRSLRATAFFLALAVPLRVLGGLLLALLAARLERLALPQRFASYVPTVLPDAATVIIWLWVINPLYGPLAVAVRAFDQTPGPVLLDPTAARLTIVAISVFALGEGFLVTLAARRELPRTVYDAASLEGARGFEMFRRVTLPLLAPVLSLLAARDLVTSLQASVVPVLLLTGGGPLDATKNLAVLTYERGFTELTLDEGAVIACVLMAGTLILVALQLRLLRRFSRIQLTA